MNRLKYFFCLLLLLLNSVGWSQLYPVQVNSSVFPPYLSSLSSYATTVDQKYLVNIYTADLNVVHRQVRLQLYIEGNGIQAQSLPIVEGAPIMYLNGGETLQLSNLDLSPYFQLENLSGINQNQYSSTLPQGNYKYCIEVYDFITNQRISQKSCTFYYFVYNEPPLLNSPSNHELVGFQDPQNLIFTWTPRHLNAVNIEYEFELVELLDHQVPSNHAFLTSIPLYKTTTSTTVLHYGSVEPQLIAGRKYAWRVKALSQPGFGDKAIFNNNGYSEIFDFIYPGNCPPPKFVVAISLNATQSKITWQTNPDFVDYKIEYRKKGTNSWYPTAYYNNEAKLYDLEAGATYEYRVGGECIGGLINYTPVEEFTQPRKEEIAIKCGIKPNIDLSNTTLFEGELPNDQIILAGDFSIKLTEVRGKRSYSGKGYVNVPYLSFVKIGVEFKDITLNTDFRLVKGEIKALYDPSWKNIIDLSSLYDQIEDGFDLLSPDTEEHQFQTNFDIPDLSHITVNSNEVVVTGTNGQTQSFDLDPKELIIIRDPKGNVYAVPPGSDKPVVLNEGQAAGFIPDASNTQGITSAGMVTKLAPIAARVTFERSAESKYADDVMPAKSHPDIQKLYKTIADGATPYTLYHKGIQNDGKGSRSFDFIDAVIAVNGTTIKPESILFNIKGSVAKKIGGLVMKNGKAYQRLEVPVYHSSTPEELLALIPGKDGAKHQVLGAAKIIPIKTQTDVNITLVPVNNATIPDGIATQLNAIYADAGVQFKVTIAPNHEVAKNTLECGKDALLEKLSEDQSQFVEQYKAGKDIQKDQYYVFVTKGITPSRAISGFMPRHSQFGFVFTNQSGEEVKAGNDLATIIGHELGHGVFELQHPWEQFSTGNKNSNTPWLMDYALGTKLAYPHWQRISHPKFGVYVLDGSEKGEIITTNLSNLTEKYKNNNGTYSFLTPSGKIITLPATTKEVAFSTLDPFRKISDGQTTGDYAPLGSLINFTTIDNKRYSYRGNNNVYSYYCVECKDNKEYKDVLSNALGNNLNKTIVAIPYYENNNIYIHLVVYPKKSEQVFNLDNVNYGDPLSDFSIITELNNGDKLNSNYFDLIKNDDYYSNIIAHGNLTDFSKNFLERYKSIASKYSPLSPIVVSSAFLFSEFDSNESNITCNINTIQEELDKQFKTIEDASNTHSSLATIRVYLSAKASELRLKELGEKYNLFRTGLQNTQNNIQTISKINTEIVNSNSPSQMAFIVNSYDKCNLELITIENRIKAITILETGNKEEEIIKLINTVTYNSQTPQLLEKLFSKNSSLFKKLWNRLDLSEFHQYINRITEYVKITDASTPVDTFSFSLDQNNNSGKDFNFSFNADGSLTIELKKYPIYSSYLLSSTLGIAAVPIVYSINEPIKTWNFTNLNQIVKVTIPANSSFLEWENNQSTDVVIDVPAYYIAYLIHKKHLEQTIFATRVLGNLVAIVTAIPSGGQSITAVQAFSLVLSGGDLIMAFSEDKIKQLDGGENFIQAWNYITVIDAAVGIYRLGISVVKKSGVISGIEINLEKFKNALKNLNAEGKDIIIKLKEMPQFLKRMGQLPSQVIFNSRILSQIEQAILNTKFTSVNNEVLSFENWVIGKIGNKKIFDIDFATSGGFLRFTDIRKSLNAGDVIIGTLNEVRYADEVGKINEGTFNIVKSGDNVYVIKIASIVTNNIVESGLVLKQYLSTITNLPKKVFRGDLVRSLSKNSELSFGATPKDMTDHLVYSSWGRYDLDGAENAMYLSKDISGNKTEITHYGNWEDYNTFKFSDVEVTNLLDLTDDAVRKQLKVDFNQLVKTTGEKEEIYEFTNVLASWAREKGYNGLIVPGARGLKDYDNVVLFDQIYIKNILKNKIPVLLNKGTGEWKVRLWEIIIEEYPILKSKWDKLPNNELKVMFRSDFENATESILKQLNQDNSILLEGWIKFRLKHPTKIICTK